MIVPVSASPVRRQRRTGGTSRQILLLATVPVMDPIINQVNTVFQPSIGPVSMLQAMRAVLMLVLLIMAATIPRGRKARGSTGAISIAILLCVAAISAHELVSTGALSQNSFVLYGQIAYWLTLWYTATICITDTMSALVVIKGIVIGAIITAVSVYYAYAIGADFSVYRGEGVVASAGWFVSGKGIAGSLVAGALLAAYMGSRGRPVARGSSRVAAGFPPPSSTLIALLCLGASLLTYARAGMVAMAVSLAWLAGWSMLTRISHSKWARTLLVTTVCGAVVFVSAIGTENLGRRWADLDQGDSAGSGRLLFWAASLRDFGSGSIPEQLFGHGTEQLSEMMYASVGIAVGSHNDFVELLVIGGLAGFALLMLTLIGVVLQIRRGRLQSSEAATAIAIFLVMCLQMFFTGQVGLPDVMGVYLLGITAVMACASSLGSAALPAARPAAGVYQFAPVGLASDE